MAGIVAARPDGRSRTRAGRRVPRLIVALARALVAVAIVSAAGEAAAQTAQGVQERAYRANAADEDWTFLKSKPKADFWDPVKYIPLGPEDWSITLSGELRFRAEGFRVRETEARPSTVDNYALQRYLVGADVRFGPRVRAFAELQTGIINGQLRSPRPTDSNALDLHQAFVELRQPVRGTHHVGLIAGRQELDIGSSRLISASPGLNVKRSFDGLAVGYRTPTWRAVAVAAQLVRNSSGAFDDRPDAGQLFWGAALTRAGLLLRRSEAGVYYLGVERDQSIYAQGGGEERRHTAGIRWSATGDALDMNYDLILQWGQFAGAPIRGWAFATETGYRFRSLGWRPRVSLRTDIASGDRDPQAPALQSFNPLFPGNSYSGAVGLLGPTNLTDLTPAVMFVPRRDLTFGFEAPSYWRTSTRDGIYGTDLRVLFPPQIGEGKYVGVNPSALVVWQPTRHVQLQGVITRFLAGGLLDDSFISSGFGFYSVTARYRF